MNEPKSKAELIKQALEALSEDYPNSIISDMLYHFPKDVVLQFLILYNGRRIIVPQVETIWKSYRNKIIFDTLVVNNSKVARQQLAEYFKVLESTVSKIFHRECNRLSPRLTQATLGKIAQVIYNKEVQNLHKDMKKLFGDKYNIQYFTLHDETQNPEDLFLLKEAIDRMQERCFKVLENHKLFIGREDRIPEAQQLIRFLITDNH